MTPEERESIIDAAVERALLKIPEVVGNLIHNHLSSIKINKKFYDEYPEFKDYRDIVATTIESIEGQDLTQDYETILRKAVPEIRRRIGSIKDLDMTTIKRPKRDFSNGEL